LGVDELKRGTNGWKLGVDEPKRGTNGWKYVPIYETYFLQNWLPKVKPNILTQFEVHPQMSNNGHPVDGALVGAGSLWQHAKWAPYSNLGNIMGMSITWHFRWFFS
jgi:hypothetical protein